MTIPSQDLHFNIGWLAGIIDGEGSIIAYRSKSNNFYHIRIYVINTDARIIERCLEIFTELDILAYVNQKTTSKKQREGSFKYSKVCWEIIISRRDAVQKLLTLISPLLVGDKKEKALNGLNYLNTNQFNAGRKSGVTTERLAPETNLERFRMKLQSALIGNSEKLAEMTSSAFKSE